ncbi:uncharacterized protein LAESUDRAFT_749901 [Laetiporus sulphureus 93-53]|uniref:Uncharacterized protein n=1 Tax=Laetiporus sulphureus 93-53 TaxID=1314785 RepID=A0A165EBS4_9APHY|nr:uncharacterized protein LAESUDRAFT_749901 [Laetiporus sulphureus 93-53]KZT06683.1 hypothetical protein LAESUDRAFT_749901 [Laetiporus sulphureus 93-53]
MLPSPVRSALDIKLAIDHAAEYLEPIGVCRTKMEMWRKCYSCMDDEASEVESTEGSEDSTTDGAAASEDNETGIRLLQELYANRDPPLKDGVLGEPFSLDITRAGCEFSGEIVHQPSIDQSGENDMKVNDNRVSQWFENATVSPFGDVQAQENKVDENVRNAREILASEFRVSPDLCHEIATIWDQNFLPPGVRVEPYKIHLYGPGGRFRTHKDTPEKGLVGTFLLGLGDSTPDDGHLEVLDDCYRADAGTWVAFHPSVPHEVTPIEDGYRAVVAFKVFKREPAPGEEVIALSQDTMQEKMRPRMDRAFAVMHAPFGLLLEHQYCMVTTEFNGFDSMLCDVVVKTAQKHGSGVHFLPVLTRFNGLYYFDTDSAGPPEAEAPVYPLTEAHVNAILQAFRSRDVRSRYEEYMTAKGRRYLKITTLDVKTGQEWLDSLKDVPFYALDFEKSSLVWKEDIEQGADYTGNEAKPETEDSIYLSYAMVVVPEEKRGKKRKAKNEL